MKLPFLRGRKKPDERPVVDSKTLLKKRASKTALRNHFAAFGFLMVGGAIFLGAVVGTTMALQRMQVSHVLRMQGILQAIEVSTPIKHPIDGVVKQVLVTNGEVVQEGQMLMALDASDLEERHFQARQHVARLMLRNLCLNALLRGDLMLNVSTELKVAVGRLNQIDELHRSVETCEARLHKEALQRSLDDGELAALEDRVKLFGRLVTADQALRAKLRQIDKTPLNAALNEALVIQSKVKSLRYGVEYSAAKQERDHAQLSLDQKRRERRAQLRRQQEELGDEMMRAEADLTEYEELMRNRFVYASSSGRVQRLRIREAGKRIAAGAYVMEIAPLATDFEVHAVIGLPDLPFISVGQAVEVRLSGSLPRPVLVPGVVTKISKTTSNKRNVVITMRREDLNKRDLLMGDPSLNGLTGQSEAWVSVKTENALRSLVGALKPSLFGTDV